MDKKERQKILDKLHENTRRIWGLLPGSPKILMEEMGFKKETINRHLRYLREKGLVTRMMVKGSPNSEQIWMHYRKEEAPERAPLHPVVWEIHKYLQKHGPLTRGELSAKLGVAMTTMLDRLGYLIDRDLVMRSIRSRPHEHGPPRIVYYALPEEK